MHLPASCIGFPQISAISAFPHAPAKNVQSSSNSIDNITYYSDNKVVNYTKEASLPTSETFLHKAAEIAEIAEIAERELIFFNYLSYR
jgi:ubiquinone biosynthesis protein COQ9